MLRINRKHLLGISSLRKWFNGSHSNSNMTLPEGTQRRLAAIVAIDVAGYSRLMGADDDGTLAALKGHREATIPFGNGNPNSIHLPCIIQVEPQLRQNNALAEFTKMPGFAIIKLANIDVLGL